MRENPKWARLKAVSDGLPEKLFPLPAEQVIRAPKGCLPAEKAGTTHGWNLQEAVQVPTSLTCNLCPLYHVKRKDRRHPLACLEGRKHQTCLILIRYQQTWAAGLIREVAQSSGEPPTASDFARIEQIIRQRSRIFQIENYLKVVGLIDLKTGQCRSVVDRLTSNENALSRALGEFRQALAEHRANRTPSGPRLDQYLKEIDASDSEGEVGKT